MIGPRPGGPTQSDLKRACSTVYYAMFHALSACCANSFIGAQPATSRAWVHAYRSLNHNTARDQCGLIFGPKVHASVQGFPVAVTEFADHFVTLQEKRHRADYDPKFNHIGATDVAADIGKTKSVLQAFDAVDEVHKRAFALFVVVKKRGGI